MGAKLDGQVALQASPPLSAIIIMEHEL